MGINEFIGDEKWLKDRPDMNDIKQAIIYLKQLQKQNDLLTLGLLQEKNKAQKLKEALQNLVNDVFAGRTPMPKHLYAYKQATKVLLEANPEEKPLGTEMADAFDKIIEPQK